MYTEQNLDELEPEYQARVRRVQQDREHYRRDLAQVNAQLKDATLPDAERQALRKRWANVMGGIRGCNEIIGEILASYAKRKAVEQTGRV
jgi:hypothetical protein